MIPRGGEELKEFLLEHSRVPVIYAAGGNCHVYVDAAADLEKALTIIVINAKVQRPGVCNAAETLLVHRDVAAEFLPRVFAELKARGVELVVDKAAGEIVDDASLKRANRTHYETEFLSLKLAVRVVDSLDEAVEHIATYGTGHSEAIVTEDLGRLGASPSSSTRPASTSTRRRASPTAVSSGWAPRSASRPRSCTRAGPSPSRSSRARSTSSGATAR